MHGKDPGIRNHMRRLIQTITSNVGALEEPQQAHIYIYIETDTLVSDGVGYINSATGKRQTCEVGFFVWQTIFVQLSLRKVQVHEPGREKLATWVPLESLNIQTFEFTSQLHFPRLGTVTALIVNMLAQQLLGNMHWLYCF